MINKGQKINDRYEIIKSIGEGGMANVYLAHDVILDRDVALKVLRGDLANDEKFVRRFQREALASSSLSHPNIVEMYDVGEDNGTYYIVMEYINGKTLKQLGQSGIRTVDYASGYSQRLDSAVRANMQEALTNLTNTLQKQFGEEYGADGIEISVHAAPAIDHQDVQGRQFSKEEYNNFILYTIYLKL